MVSPAEKTTQPSTVAHQKAQQQPFFRKAEEGSFFNGGSIQPKLNIGQRGDKFEQHADAMADKVVSKSATNTPAIQAKPDDRNSEEKLDKKGEEQKPEVGALQRKEMFESEGDPDVQRSIYPENDEGEKVFRSESDAQSVSMGKGEAIVSVARSKLGKVRAKEGLPGEGGKQLRFGYETLLEIFHLAAPGVWSDDVIKNQGDGLPSWCGIFAVYCIKKSGIDIGTWQMGKGVSSFGKLKQTSSPQAGDIGYMDAHQHHAIVVKVEGDIVHSIDGNSGLKSEIIENQRPKKAYRGFFTALQNEVTSGGDVQKKENAGNSNEASPSIEGRINSSKGGGSQLDNSTRREMESGFGNDFSDVRVHTGSEAQQMSKDLNAQAFTHGQDIYFDQGKYNPQTSSGKHLLAHELTHTVQQTGGVQKMVQKDGNKASDKTTTDPSSVGTTNGEIYTHPTLGSIDVGSSKVITIPEIKVPSFKVEFGPSGGFSLLKKGDDERPTDQIQVWEKDAMKGDGFDKKLESKLKTENSPRMTNNKKDIFYLRLKNETGNSGLVFGTADIIKKRSARPNWNKKGEYLPFDVDHQREYQLGGDHNTSNMWLLESSANRSSGSKIKNEINQCIDKVLAPARISFGKKVPETASDAKRIFNITISNGVKDGSGSKKDSLDFWELSKIKNGEQLDGLKALSKKEISSQNLAGSADKLMIYATSTGGMRVQIPWDDTKKSKEVNDLQFGKNLKIQNVFYDKNEGGIKYIQVVAFKEKNKTIKKSASIKLDIEENPGVEWGGILKKDKTLIADAIKSIEVPPMSPVIFSDADITEEGLIARGKINSSIPAIQKADIDVIIDGNGAHIEKTFNSGELNIPSPFKISNSSLTVSVGTAGIALNGKVNFGIKNIGEGFISGQLSKDEISFIGSFDFDPKLFKGKVKQAGINAAYDRQNGWKIEGDLTFAENAVKGIKSGNIHVAYANEILKAEGTAETTIKGVKEVTLKIVFGKDEFEIEGGVKIEKLPGIKEGDGTLKVVKKDNDYDFSGSGKITPDIKGLDTQLDFEFHNDIFSVDATIKDFKYGRLSGTLKVGITNQVMADGKPTSKAGKDYSVYGKSDLELKIIEGVVATASVELKPNGDMIVKGGVKLPAKFEVVPKLFSIQNKPIIPFPTISIPLFGIPLGGTTIGLGATITPKLLATVQLGPGNLTNTKAEVTFDPKNPDDMSITGGSDFEFTAEAGITAGVDFGIAVSAGPASVTGGIYLSAFIKAVAKQPVFRAELKYSPKTGFELDGKVQAILKAILGFSGTLFLKAEVDVFIASASKRIDYELFKKEIDTGLDIGFEFPFNYKNGKSDISFDNLKFTYPKFDEAFINNIKRQMIDPVKEKIF